MDKFIEHFNNLVLPEGKREERDYFKREKGGDVAEKIHNPR